MAQFSKWVTAPTASWSPRFPGWIPKPPCPRDHGIVRPEVPEVRADLVALAVRGAPVDPAALVVPMADLVLELVVRPRAVPVVRAARRRPAVPRAPTVWRELLPGVRKVLRPSR